MSATDRLRLKQVATLERLQTVREERVTRQLASAQKDVVRAEHMLRNAVSASERTAAEQTQARAVRWRAQVGLELSGSTIQFLNDADKEGLSSIALSAQAQQRAQDALESAKEDLKAVQEQARVMRTITSRRGALRRRVYQDVMQRQRMTEEVQRDQYAQIMFACRVVDAQE